MKNIFTKILVLTMAAAVFASCAPQKNSAATPIVNAVAVTEQPNTMDELNPFDENIEEQLQQMDEEYYQATGQSPFEALLKFSPMEDCKRINCPVFAYISKSEQKLYLYINQQLQSTWLVSTGLAGSTETPLLDKHPNGRIYDSYTSTKYPSGDYRGLGNMPYAVFIHNGFAMHGTTQGNFKKLGQKASHGCIRMHPDNGYIFNRLVRNYGINSVWVQIVN